MQTYIDIPRRQDWLFLLLFALILLARISHRPVIFAGVTEGARGKRVPGGWRHGRAVSSGAFRRSARRSRFRGLFRGSVSGCSQCRMRRPVLHLVGKGRGHGEFDAAHTGADESADLQQLEPDRAAGGFGELGTGEADAA
jgi:hypothetical protein